MAFESTTLMYTLTAWASIHLSQIDTRFQEVALQHRGAALRLLKTELEETTISREIWLAVTMALCSMEIISDGVQNWYEHLVGGATALRFSLDRSAPHSSDITELATIEGKWLMKNFAYHDILTSVTMDRPPILAGDYWVDQDDQPADPYFGLAGQIVFLVGQTSHLNADLAAAKSEDPLFSYHLPGRAVGAKFSDRARAIENELLDWKYPSQYCGSSLAQLAETYRDAALLHLYRTLRRHLAAYATVLNQKIRRHVESICAKVRDMPTGCLPECTLLFPLFMAGGEAEELAHIAVIREKMRVINENRRFRNIEVCLQILDELWRLRIAGAGNESGNRVDWLDVIQLKGYKLAIT
ncbi:hypothetical protein PFICI_06096 [Pestalotiopsis fici W106-1]|uniref:Transcription factor domain-containing protein n=1 Tax=Pestalotiopsis fici (strain W106-1 / CGMCC3.15140) TaxID=1229662 RepID=W3X508_PESFW|nr:uncharacterized protein PFICI_06096 [Pestalotiopsis fici W106-1]ETS81094.1 hypothetical protein PFICI_06096 [Pestalotiopsis fici W106-1]